MEPAPPPGFRYSASAAAALEHLRGVEKQMQDEGLVFDKGTLQHLEDAIKAIKELEEERSHILELLEEETIKNCNLRVRVKEIPEMVMKEFEELVAAAHRARFSKINEIQTSVQEIIFAIEQTCSKLLLAKERNRALWEEQKVCRGEQEAAIGRLNQHLKSKHCLSIQINELYNIKKDEEEEAAWQIQVTDDLEKRMALEVSEFTEQQELLERQIAELQSDLKDKRLKVSQKRVDYESLLAVLKAFQEQVEEKDQSVLTEREELAKLLKNIKSLLKEYENKKAEKKKILRKNAKLQTSLAGMDLHFKEEKEALVRQVTDVEKQLDVAVQSNQKHRDENNLLNKQYDSMVDDEGKFSSRRDQLAKEFERLSNEIAERLDRVAKRVMEIQGLEDENERLQDVLDTSKSSYMREMQLLELTLQRETDRSTMLQDELDKLIGEFQKLQNIHDGFVSDTTEKTEAGHRMHHELLKQNEELELAIARSEENLKTLNSRFLKKDAWFKEYSARVTEELQTLEDKYKTEIILLQEKEEKLSIDIPYSEKVQLKLNKTTSDYEHLMALYTALQEEETILTNNTAHSLREIGRLRRLKSYVKEKIDTLRDTANKQLNIFSESLKFLERDYYEISRKLYIVDTENARFRKAIVHLREDISTLENEAEAYRLKREQTQMEVRVFHDLFDKRWSRDKHLWQLFLKGQHKVRKSLEGHIERFKKRNELVNYVSGGLQLNYERLAALVKSEATTELHKVT